jgi:hypothetical protein
MAIASAGPLDRPFPGGEISQLAINDGPTEGSFANLTYEYERCGTEPGETACTWQIDVGLALEGFELCPSNLEASRTIWSSGEQSANGRVGSGPETFALRGTPGQLLCVVLQQTSSREEGGWKYKGGGSAVLEALVMGPELISPFEAAEGRIITANPPAQIGLPPFPSTFLVSSNCHAVTIGNVRYAFAFRQIDCRKATSLANMAHLSHTAPSGYRCASRQSGGMRCWRQGHRGKYFEWHIPRA